jgi:hypothetical protein
LIALATSIIGCTGQRPAGASAWHFAARFAAVAIAPRTIVAELASTAALTSTATASGAPRSAGATVSRTATPISAAAGPATPVEGIALTLCSRHQIDDVQELAALLRTLRGVLALKDTHEPHLADPSSHNVQGFHQA